MSHLRYTSILAVLSGCVVATMSQGWTQPASGWTQPASGWTQPGPGWGSGAPVSSGNQTAFGVTVVVDGFAAESISGDPITLNVVSDTTTGPANITINQTHTPDQSTDMYTGSDPYATQGSDTSNYVEHDGYADNYGTQSSNGTDHHQVFNVTSANITTNPHTIASLSTGHFLGSSFGVASEGLNTNYNSGSGWGGSSGGWSSTGSGWKGEDQSAKPSVALQAAMPVPPVAQAQPAAPPPFAPPQARKLF